MPESDKGCKASGKCFFCNTTEVESHDVILQGLDESLVYGNEEYELGVENFTGTEESWTHVPVIYAPTHPNPLLVARDLNAALKAVDGRIGGTALASEIVTTGHPRLMVKLDITDAEAKALHQKNELLISSAFIGFPNQATRRLDGKVIPNHILIYPKTGSPKQRDPRAMFLNQEDNMTENIENGGQDVKSLLQKIIDLLSGKAPGGVPPAVPVTNTEAPEKDANMTDELKDQPVAQNQKVEDFVVSTRSTHPTVDQLVALNQKVEDLSAQVTAKDAEITALKGQVTAFENQKRDATWEATKAKLPKGFVNQDKEKELREQFEKEPQAFMNTVLDFKMTPPTKEEGKEFVNQDVNEEAQKDISELKESTGRE